LESPTLTVAEAASKSYSDMLSQSAHMHHLSNDEDESDNNNNSNNSILGGTDASNERKNFAAFGLWGPAAQQLMAARKKSGLKGKFAVLGLMGTTLLELATTHPAMHILGFK
jgi:hypothetical protein